MNWFRAIGTVGLVLGSIILLAHAMGFFGRRADAEDASAGRLEVTSPDGARRDYAMSWQPITRNVMGKAWPLVGDAAVVGCSREYPGRSVILVVDDVPWAMNGLTKGWQDKGKLFAVAINGEERVVHSFDSPPAWWAIDPDNVFMGIQGHKDITPVVEVARGLGCLKPAGSM